MLKRLVVKKIDEFSFLMEHWGYKNSQLSYHFYIVCTSYLIEQVDTWFTFIILCFAKKINFHRVSIFGEEVE